MAINIYASKKELVSVLGEQAALQLAACFGGRTVSVPHPDRLKDEGKLVAAIGRDAALRMAREWRGFEVMVPQFRSEILKQRNKEILAATERGASASELARRFKLSMRAIVKIRSNGG